MASDAEAPIKPFAAASAWEEWLAEHHEAELGVWLQIAKKASGIPTVSHEEALDVALCHGWIDGQRKSGDSDYFLQKFTPRRPKSLWSKRNVAKALLLIDSARMRPAGLAQVEAAQLDGRWDAAYDAQRDMVIPEDFLLAVRQDEQAAALFDSLNKTSRFTIGWRLQTAKTAETRTRRFGLLLEMLKRGETP